MTDDVEARIVDAASHRLVARDWHAPGYVLPEVTELFTNGFVDQAMPA